MDLVFLFLAVFITLACSITIVTFGALLFFIIKNYIKRTTYKLVFYGFIFFLFGYYAPLFFNAKQDFEAWKFAFSTAVTITIALAVNEIRLANNTRALMAKLNSLKRATNGLKKDIAEHSIMSYPLPYLEFNSYIYELSRANDYVLEELGEIESKIKMINEKIGVKLDGTFKPFDGSPEITEAQYNLKVLIEIDKKIQLCKTAISGGREINKI